MIRGVLPKPPRFLTRAEALSLHETAIDEHGGSYGVRDAGLLESAIAMPQQGFAGEFAHEVPFSMAAAYLFHICKNHPFIDGNKRTALVAAVTFLWMNGWSLVAAEPDAVQCVLDVATDALSKEGLAAWLEQHAKARPTLELRDFARELGYKTLASTFAGIAVGTPEERYATITEASRAIPAINEANIGALHAEEHGNTQAANILRQHAMLLTALFRVAEDAGYEW